MTLEIENLAAMEAFGRRFAERLQPGDVVAFIGPLGAGKTHLARAIAEGLGTTSPVTSPTFVLIQEYDGRLPIYHFDVYRLKSADEFLDLGAMEYMHGDGVCLIEWADRVREHLPDRTITVQIEPVDSNRRTVTIRD